MWFYKSKIGTLYIKRRPNGRYGFFYDGECWEDSNTPEAEAENIRAFSTGCWDWDKHDRDINFPYPSDLSEWEYCQT